MKLRLLLLVFFVVPLSAQDALDEALAQAGFSRNELGWVEQGYWSRWPRAVDYELDHFDALFAEPLAVVTFTRTMGQAVREHLSPEAIAEAKGPLGARSLHRLAYAVGIERKYGGFRDYSVNLTAEPTPIDLAILDLYRAADRQSRFVTFGTESPYPKIADDLRAAAEALPPETSGILGQLVLEIVTAHRWAELAFRKVSMEERLGAAERLDLGVETVDALEYPWIVDDAAKALDEASLWYAALRLVESLDRARRALDASEAEIPGDLRFDWETPWGWIRVRGTGADSVDGENALLVVDLGGDDTYTGGVAASTATRPIGLLLDLAGNDRYDGGRVAQGAGVCGIGILVDAAGADTYRAEHYAQGVGQLGFGALFDLAGNDRYVSRWSSQGCGYLGVGLLADADGDDVYEIHADGQGFGGVGGVGTLADRSGNDRYVAEPDAKISGRPSYHSDLEVSVSNVQGCAMGRRGDGADGHSWAGGLGALLDVEGDDDYTAGNWSLGTGYWFGMGIVYEGAGNDTYRGSVWSQGSGAHFCIGALLDEGGDDQHLMTHTSRNGLAFAHDFTIAMLLNLGGGNDTYEIAGDGLCFQINRSVALLVDDAGDDTYRTKEGNLPGTSRFDKRFEDRGTSTYFADTSSIALFLDLAGTDTYSETSAGDGKTWGDRAPEEGEAASDNWRVRNPGVGIDREGGAIDWRPRRVKSR